MGQNLGKCCECNQNEQMTEKFPNANYISNNVENSNDNSFQMNTLMMPMLISGIMNDETGATSENAMSNETLFMMFYMMQNQKQDNSIMLMLPMMMLNNKGANKSEMFETLMMMQMMQNGNFSNMFGPCYNKIDETKTVKKNNTVKSDKKDKSNDTVKDQ